MPLGYKYAERDADSFVDWSAVGKNLSDALATEAQDRRDKIQAFEDQNVKDIDLLNSAPQGKFDPANKFTNNFAHDAKEMSLINYRLLRAGKMDPRKYTLSRQNLMNGTEQMFELQKTYQKEFDDVMEGVQTGDLQALNIAFMSMVERFGDFTRSKGVINPLDGTVNIGMMAPNPKTGVMELTKDVMPVSVAMGKLTTRIKTFKVDEAINNSIAAFGDRKEAIYNAANIVKAGTITELTGIEALEKYPQFKNTITKFNEAVDGTIAGYFAGNSYNLSSVLTQNVGGYDANSFIYDKDEADKDPTKILLKIDPNTKLPVMDESAPHFAEQKKKAETWVRNQIMNRLDSERKVSTTSQLNQLRERPEKSGEEKTKESKAINFGKMLAYALTGDAAQKQQASDYFKSIPGLKGFTPTTTGIEVLREDGSKLPFSYVNAGVKAKPEVMGRSLVKSLNLEGLDEDIIIKNMNANIPKGAEINPNITASGKTIPKFTSNPIKAFNTFVSSLPNEIPKSNNEGEQADWISSKIGNIEGVTVKGTGIFGDYVTVYYNKGKKNEKKIEVKTGGLDANGRKKSMDRIKGFLNSFTNIEKEDSGLEEEEGGGVGSKY